MQNLTLLFLVPFAASIIAFFFPTVSGKILKRFCVFLSLIPLAMLVYSNDQWIGAKVDAPWLPALSIRFELSIDSLSLLFLYLANIVIPLSLLSVRSREISYPNIFCGLILLLQGLLIGFFTARDLALFTVFWEAMLIPLYFIINIWGNEQRQAASLKFLVYMVAGSVFMVAAVLSLFFSAKSLIGTGTFSLEVLQQIAPQTAYVNWLFWVFIIAFAVKTPLFPFHAWLPDTYCQAPTSGTILLSGILSKAGIYGILRIGMELFPSQVMLYGKYLLVFAIAGVFYSALAAWVQRDYKRLIAYCSLSHVNFVLAGLFVWNHTAQSGAILQAINHGLTIAALFLVVGWLEERIGSTSIDAAGGLAKPMPKLCWITLIFVVSSVALPGTNNFVGEFLTFFGLFTVNPWMAALLGLSIILSAIYMLRWMKKLFFGQVKNPQTTWKDINTVEVLVSVPFIILIIWIGIYPSPILQKIQPAAEKIVAIAQLEDHK